MNVLMVGVDSNRKGGMWTVAEMFIEDKTFNNEVQLFYVATATGGSAFKRLIKMFVGYAKIIHILIHKKIDIVHLHMAEKGSTFRKGYVIDIAKLFSKKVVVQMHAGPFMAWYFTLSDRRKKKVKKFFDRSDVVLALGEYWKKQLSRIVSINKLRVVYNGSYCPKERNYNINGKNIVFMGLLKKEKGILDLLKAIKVIDSKLPTNTMVLLCGEDVEGNIQSLINDMELNDRVKMLGWITKEQRDQIFKDTQLCVLPSYAEALSMTVIESMCYGIPIITTDITTMRELVGEEIKLVEPGNVTMLADTLLYYSTNAEEREKSSLGLFKRANQMFSTKKCISDVLDIYKSL